jgi:flagellar L-ring protein FlgH
MRNVILPSLICLSVAACSVAPRDIAREPHLTPLGSGLAVDRVHPVVETAQPAARFAGASTWRDTSADLFRDARAGRVGDVITVKIAMKDKASLDSSSNRSRDATGAIGGTLKYALAAIGLTGSGEAELDAKLKGATSTQGRGAISRSESIDLMLAAVVTEVLPNGNLVISGSQEVRVNFEVRVLNVAGIVRPSDVGSENLISYDKIAEARISYGGRGRITEVQQPAWGQQIVDLLSPY